MPGVKTKTSVGMAGCLLLACSLANGEMYRCEQNGQVTFSQLPCGDSAQRMELDSGPQPAPTPVQGGAAAPAMDVDAYIEERRYRRRLEQLKGRRTALTEERDRRVAELEQEIPQPSEYAPYSSYWGDIEKIRRDIEHTRNDYDRRIEQVNDEIRAHMRNKPNSPE